MPYEGKLITAVSNRDLEVVAGHSYGPYAGVAVMSFSLIDLAKKYHRISLVEVGHGIRRGIVFEYKDTARVFIDDILSWTNLMLNETPTEDFSDIGIAKIEFFHSDPFIQMVENNRAGFALLGLAFNY